MNIQQGDNSDLMDLLYNQVDSLRLAEMQSRSDYRSLNLGAHLQGGSINNSMAPLTFQTPIQQQSNQKVREL